MGEDKKKAADNTDESVRESDADSAAFTKEREDAAREKLALQQEQAKEQFVFLGENEPEVEIPAPEDRPIDTDNMREAEVEALKTQNAIASDDYEPKSLDEFVSETFDSPDINPEAKEFQLKKDFTASDEHTGPEAARKAAETGVNPRSAATASDREGMEQPADPDLMAPVSENAEPVEKAGKARAETPDVLDD
jgi:hypothetical protein